MHRSAIGRLTVRDSLLRIFSRTLCLLVCRLRNVIRIFSILIRLHILIAGIGLYIRIQILTVTYSA